MDEPQPAGYGAYADLAFDADGTPPAADRAPELADVRRYGRRLVNRWVQQAREAERPKFRTIIGDYLDIPTEHLPITEEHWPAYEHVNVQAALDAWVAVRGHHVVGVTGYRHRGPFGMAELVGTADPDGFNTPRPGNVSRVTLPAGPDGLTRECYRASSCSPGTATLA